MAGKVLISLVCLALSVTAHPHESVYPPQVRSHNAGDGLVRTSFGLVSPDGTTASPVFTSESRIVAGGVDSSNFLPNNGELLFPHFDSNINSIGFDPRSGSVNFNSATGFKATPVYEDHVFPRSGSVPVTKFVTDTVTKTHTLRVPSTSDVWVTSLTSITVPVTLLSTQRRYTDGPAGTVTSVVRVTKTSLEVITRTVQIAPTKTNVSVFTVFRTATKTEEFWQPIVHVHTNYEVQTLPVLVTQTLLQRSFTTVTSTTVRVVTSVVQPVVPRAGVFRPHQTYLPQY